MTQSERQPVSHLIRRLREAAGMTQSELAVRVGTTQSVISRLESDDYEGHSLSMLYRIAAALDRTIEVSAVDRGTPVFPVPVVRERAAAYDARPGDADTTSPAATPAPPSNDPVDFDRLADRIAERFGRQGLTKADVQEAIRWARRGAGDAAAAAIERLRGGIEVGPGDVVDDIRRARARRGADRAAGV